MSPASDKNRRRADAVEDDCDLRPAPVAPGGEATSEADRPARLEEALRQSEQRFELLVRSVQDYGIFLLDPQGRVTSWNEGAARIEGYREEEILGRSFEVFYPEDAVAEGFPRYELERAARDGRFEDENWRVRKDGSRYWANVIITALRDGNGKLVGFAKVTRDLSARRAAEEQARRLAAEQAAYEEAKRRSRELEELNAKLKTANDDLQAALGEAKAARRATEQAMAALTIAYRELDQFAYITSHDLKAPLRGIGNLAQWVREDLADKLEGESIEHLRLLQVRVERMESLIDGILAYSRAGRVMRAPETIDTAELVREIVELIAAPEGARIRVADGLPVVRAERIPLEQVFMNLVGNALKHGSAVRDDVQVDIRSADLGDAWQFSVADNGPGIAPEFHQRIFEMFQTLSPRDRVEGTGVGLAVVKKIVESRGGSVSLESEPGKGAVFRFTLPKTPKTKEGQVA